MIVIKIIFAEDTTKGTQNIKTILHKGNLRDNLDYEKFINYLKDNFCTTFTDFNGRTIPYNPITVSGESIILPRFAYCELEEYFNMLGVQYKILATKKYPELCDVNFGKLKIDLFPAKLKMLSEIEETIKNKNGIIIQLGTGEGKTVLISEIIRRTNKKIHIVAKTSELQNQMYDDIHENLILGEDECDNCYRCKISKCNYIAFNGGKKSKHKHNQNLLKSGNYKILISTINTARNMPQSISKDFELTILDECHTYTSDENSNVFNLCNTKYVIGTTATPYHKWNHLIVTHNLGKVVNFNKYLADRKFNGTVYKIKYRGPPEFTQALLSKTSVLSPAKMVKQFMDDPYRCQLIIDNIIEGFNLVGYGYVYGMRNDLLYKLKEMLDIYVATNGINLISVVLCSETKPEELELCKTTAHIIFTNYSYSEGLNIPRMRFMVFASPFKTNCNQILGRVLRNNFEDMRYYFDIIDILTALAKQYLKREASYKEKKFTIVERNITYKEILI